MCNEFNYKWETDDCDLACVLIEVISQGPSPYYQIYMIYFINIWKLTQSEMIIMYVSRLF